MHTDPTFDPNSYPAPAPARRRGLMIVAGLGVVALLALLAGGLFVLRAANSATAVQASSIASKQASATSATSAPAATTDTPAVLADEGTAASDAGQSSTGNSTGNGGGAATPSPAPAPAPQPTPAPAPPTTTPKPAAPAPVITSFTTPENIDCHNGNSQTFTASWTTTNATKVTISIDGPGVYKTYPANGSDSLPYNCSSAHTFKLTAYGQDGKTVSKTITLQPRNVQVPSSNTED